jgi:hypothetical protein
LRGDVLVSAKDRNTGRPGHGSGDRIPAHRADTL